MKISVAVVAILTAAALGITMRLGIQNLTASQELRAEIQVSHNWLKRVEMGTNLRNQGTSAVPTFRRCAVGVKETEPSA